MSDEDKNKKIGGKSPGDLMGSFPDKLAEPSQAMDVALREILALGIVPPQPIKPEAEVLNEPASDDYKQPDEGSPGREP